MQRLLYIPWFRAEPLELQLPFELPVIGQQLDIQPFGVLVATGVIVASLVAQQFAKRNGRSPTDTADLVLYVVVFAFVASYWLNGLFYETDALFDVLRHPSQIFEHWLGLSSFGGFIGAALGALFWRWRRQGPFLPIADAAAFCFPFGWFFGRLGCFVVHDHPGRSSDFFLAVADYRTGVPPYVPRHDLGLYEVFVAVFIIGVFLWLARKPRPPGLYVALLPLLYTPLRFMLDFLRAPMSEGGDIRYFGLTPGQYGSIAFFVFGLWLLRYVLRANQPGAGDPADYELT